MPAAAKSGSVSSKMRPLDRAMVSVFSVIVVMLSDFEPVPNRQSDFLHYMFQMGKRSSENRDRHSDDLMWIKAVF